MNTTLTSSGNQIFEQNEVENQNQFAIHMFDVGNYNDFFYSLFCPCCALAQSRNSLDGSSYIFNLFCLPLAPYRWLVRSAYGIGDKNCWIEDLMLSLCCPCFVINQIYQTTKVRGNPTSDGGLNFNIHHFTIENNNWCDNIFELCCLQPCTVGKAANHAIGIPYFLSCLCINICFLRNIVRYHYRIQPKFEKDEYDELYMPIGTCIGGLCFCNPVLSMAYSLSMIAQVIAEVKARPKATNKMYLLGYVVEIEDAALIEEMNPYCVYDYPNRFGNDSPFKPVDLESVETVSDIREYCNSHNDVTRLTDLQISVAPLSPLVIRTPAGNLKYIIPAEEVKLAR